MKIIYKYPITSASNPVSECETKMPRNSKILSIQIQNDNICAWAMVDTEEPLVPRCFLIKGTGHEFYNGQNFTYIATIQSIFMFGIFLNG